MGEATFQVVFLGNLRPGTAPEKAADKLVALFGLDPDRAEHLVSSGKQMVVRKGATRKQAMAIRQRLEEAGLLTRMVEEEGASVAPAAAGEQAGTGTPPAPPRAAAGRAAVNPYAAPKARLEEAGTGGTESRHDPVRVPAGHGWRWVADAFTMLKEYPLSWPVAILLMYLLIMPVNMIPGVGWLVAYLVGPLLTGGLMIGAHAQAEGEGFRIGHLFAGFSQNRNRLLGLGAVFGLFGVAIMLVIFVFTGGMLGLASGPNALNFANPAIRSAIASSGGILLFGLVGLVLGTLFIMASWFATVLVAVDGESPLSAIRLSLGATWKNGLAFLVSGLVFFLVVVAVGVVLGIIAALLGRISPGLSPLWNLLPVVVLGLLGLGSMCVATVMVYTSYRDIFRR